MKEALKSTIVKVFLTFISAVTLVSLTEEANGPHGIIEGGKALILATVSLMGFVYAYLIAEQDSKLTIRGAHVKEWLLRCVFMAAIPLILYIQEPRPYVIWVALCGAFSFFLVFNIFYNRFKDYPLDYVGNEALTDRAVRYLGIQKYYFLIRLIFWLASHSITIAIIL